MALDMEPEGGIDPDWALKWLVAFEGVTGVRPIIYLNLASINNYDWSKVQTRGHELWLADYGDIDNGSFRLPRVTKYWGSPRMHQYTSRGKVYCDGDFVAEIDRDVFYGTATDWKALATVHEEWKH